MQKSVVELEANHQIQSQSKHVNIFHNLYTIIVKWIWIFFFSKRPYHYWEIQADYLQKLGENSNIEPSLRFNQNAPALKSFKIEHKWSQIPSVNDALILLLVQNLMDNLDYKLTQNQCCAEASDTGSA